MMPRKAQKKDLVTSRELTKVGLISGMVSHYTEAARAETAECEKIRKGEHRPRKPLPAHDCASDPRNLDRIRTVLMSAAERVGPPRRPAMFIRNSRKTTSLAVRVRGAKTAIALLVGAKPCT